MTTRRSLLLLAPIALFACSGKAPDDESAAPDSGAADDRPCASTDADRDGSNACEDCDDTDPELRPDNLDGCDGLDNNCDGEIDEDSATATWYTDADGDGYGDDATALTTCEAPDDAVETGGDCDDGDATIAPGREERCDSVDNDCDGAIDEEVETATWYPDADGDGYGVETGSLESCATPDGYAAQAGDCDDDDADISPGDVEYCDGVDEDCDGEIDNSPFDGQYYYYDGDADGFGDVYTSLLSCDDPLSWVEDTTDCDDDNAEINPDAAEICDEIDNDCDGAIDDADDSLDASDGGTWYSDADADGYGDADGAITACEEPSDVVSDASDCDDSDATISPDGTESCNGLDDDCSGSIDDGSACTCTVQTYGSGTYLFCNTAATWTNAQTACAGWGYHLVDMDDAAENTWVVDTALTIKADKWWSGYNDKTTEGTFAWDGGSTSTYTNWNTGEPNDSGKNEDCTELYRFSDYTWNDGDCNGKLRYVCEL